ncbi:MAG: bifunctional phosphopantothenoylcysteine decarboxylase/phosphopantothenate--cysteine ligase CoaBC [Actinomycetota bacterium]
MLLGVTGGIAAYKSVLLARLLGEAGAHVQTVLTDAATRFVGADTFSGLTGVPAHVSLWETPGEVLHVRMARDAEMAIVAPATANVIAKLAHGIADDLLTATLLEARCPLLIAPAMHTGMWEHPATRGNVALLAARGAAFVGPETGSLAHGDAGLGRLAEPETIFAVAAELAGARHDLAGRRIIVTAGPTHEPIDPVRFLGNRSSGKMGVALAADASARGADVTLILGPNTVEGPPGVRTVHVRTAQEMRDEVMAAFPDADAVIMAAAVADFRPKTVTERKIKKEEGAPELVLEPTPDILSELGRIRTGQILVGFAAETSDVEAAGGAKLRRKGLDLVVANLVGREGSGFGSDTNEAAILSANGEDEPLRTWTKRDLARAVVDRVIGLLELR